MQPRIVEVREGILKKNDLAARELRGAFRAGGPRRGEPRLEPRSGEDGPARGDARQRSRRSGGWRPSSVTWPTDNDARRLGRAGVPVRQIVTGTVCHLEAQMVGQALEGWDLAELDLLFLENVGNLVCPASYDLGRAPARRAHVRDRGRGQAAQVPDDLQLGGPRGHHQGGPGRGDRVRSRAGVSQHRGRAPGPRDPGDVGTNRAGHGPLARAARGAGGAVWQIGPDAPATGRGDRLPPDPRRGAGRTTPGSSRRRAAPSPGPRYAST